MGRPVSFKQSDLERAIRAFQRRGLPVAGAEIVNGKIIVLTARPDSTEAPDPLSQWERKHGLDAA